MSIESGLVSRAVNPAAQEAEAERSQVQVLLWLQVCSKVSLVNSA